jgi:murein DD-endopeptidase MepM/ murein hydrolase activator NlpD
MAQATPRAEDGRQEDMGWPIGWRFGSAALIVAGLALLALLAAVRPASTAAPSTPPSPVAGPPLATAATDVAAAAFARGPERLLADGELVYGPLTAGWDTGAFLAQRRGAMTSHREVVAGAQRTAAEIVDEVARTHSVSPRVLLALIEAGSGLVDGAGDPGALAAPLGEPGPSGGLHPSLSRAASWLNDGFYGVRHRGELALQFADGSRRPAPESVAAGAAHFAVARFLALQSDEAGWRSRTAAFASAYERLFGPPPPSTEIRLPPQPPFLLPWAEGESWHYTGGPHGGWGVASGWAAVDFAPPGGLGCGPAPHWVLAAAPGVVTYSHDGLVLVDLDGDGHEGTGWVLVYLHLATPDRIAAGARVAAGDRLGHPSCEGGRATGAHVHFARRFDGVWVPAAGGPAPMDLSGWQFTGGAREYDGTMVRAGEETRVAVTSRRTGRTDVPSDNGPARHAALAPAWKALAAAAPLVVRAADSVSATTPPTPQGAEVALGAGDTADSLVVRLRLEDRTDHTTSFGLALVAAGAGADEPAVALGRTAPDGTSRPVALPPLPPGAYTVTLRVPGYKPSSVLDVPLGNGPVTIDFSRGGIAPLRAGDLTLDDRVDRADLGAWLQGWWSGGPEADVDGDGEAGLADLRRILGNRGRPTDDR